MADLFVAGLADKTAKVWDLWEGTEPKTLALILTQRRQLPSPRMAESYWWDRVTESRCGNGQQATSESWPTIPAWSPGLRQLRLTARYLGLERRDPGKFDYDYVVLP